jgi:DNA modification methylase
MSELTAKRSEIWHIDKLIPFAKNSRTHSDEQVAQIAASIKEWGWTTPVLIDPDGMIVAGHGRILAARKLGIADIPVVVADGWTDAQKRAYVIADNKLALNAGWDDELLRIELGELGELGFDLDLIGFDAGELDDLFADDETTEGLTDEDAVPEVPEVPVTVLGDVWLLGKHRLMCGDSTSVDAVERLMDGQKADMVFTDPPYGMKKEKDGVLNDNLNYDDLLEFNRQWIPLSFAATKDNGSWYCWGIDEPLMDIYSAIIKPMIKIQQATFRNLITWAKGNGQGQNSENTRSYAIADEKCLFVMCGVQGFNNNADNYFEGWEPIRDYLLEQRLKAGWDIPTMKEIAGHSGKSRDHWTGKSQWNMPTQEVYKSFQKWCIDNNIDAFKREYDEIKREYYSTRAYFNNTHDNFNNVWEFKRHARDGSEGGHATPKPIELCERAIKSSSERGQTVLDLFGGSGSTLIGCEKTKRNARLMELDPKYCDVIIKRWQDFTGKAATLESSGQTFSEVKNGKTTN